MSGSRRARLSMRQQAALAQHAADLLAGAAAHVLPTQHAGYAPRIGVGLGGEAKESGTVWRRGVCVHFDGHTMRATCTVALDSGTSARGGTSA